METPLPFYSEDTEPLNELLAECSDLIVTTFKQLLQEESLYQYSDLKIDEIKPRLAEFKKNYIMVVRDFYKDSTPENIFNEKWKPSKKKSQNSSLNKFHEIIFFKVDRIRIMCTKCKEVRTFTLTNAIDIETNPNNPNNIFQNFIFAFQCTECTNDAEVITFLVRRERIGRIRLCGRSPIEKNFVPKYIPDIVHDFYSDAYIAHKTGNTLSGLFLLRTLVEQYLRNQTNDYESENIEELDKKYKNQLKSQFHNEKFVSEYPQLFALVYTPLSKAIHLAKEENEGDYKLLFNNSLNYIKCHFEGLEVHNNYNDILR